jgi:hypothetical protein
MPVTPSFVVVPEAFFRPSRILLTVEYPERPDPPPDG